MAHLICEDCGEDVPELEYFMSKDRCPECIERLTEQLEEE